MACPNCSCYQCYRSNPPQITDRIYYSIDEVMRFLADPGGQGVSWREFFLDKPITFTRRLRTFLNSGTVCTCCGLEGTYFSLEKVKGTGWVLNLYGVNEDGYGIVFTQDHIVPRSVGGKNLGNLQTMCATCNSIKGAGSMPPPDARRRVELINNELRFVKMLFRRKRRFKRGRPNRGDLQAGEPVQSLKILELRRSLLKNERRSIYGAS